MGEKPFHNQAALYEHVQEKPSITEVCVCVFASGSELAEKGFPLTQQLFIKVKGNVFKSFLMFL